MPCVCLRFLVLRCRLYHRLTGPAVEGDTAQAMGNAIRTMPNLPTAYIHAARGANEVETVSATLTDATTGIPVVPADIAQVTDSVIPTDNVIGFFTKSVDTEAGCR